MPDMAWPSRLNQLLSERRWSNADFKRAMGGAVSESTISRWTSGERVPRLDEAVVAATALGVSVDDLAENTTSPGPIGLSSEEKWAIETVRALGFNEARRRLLAIPPLPESIVMEDAEARLNPKRLP